MFDEDLESLRRALDAFNRRDREAWIASVHPDAENHPPRDWPESERTRGSEALWEFFRAGNEVWGEGTLELGEAIDPGDGRIVVEVAGEMQGQASGAPVHWSFWLMAAFRDGLPVEFTWFGDRPEAHEAAGVRSPD